MHLILAKRVRNNSKVIILDYSDFLKIFIILIFGSVYDLPKSDFCVYSELQFEDGSFPWDLNLVTLRGNVCI